MNRKSPDKRQLEPWKIKLICTKCLSTDPKVRDTARHMGISPNTVSTISSKLRILGYTRAEEINALSDEEILRRFYPKSSGIQLIVNEVDRNNKYVPDFNFIARDMIEKKKDINKAYEEYREVTFKTKALPFSKGYFSRRVLEIYNELKEMDNYFFAQEFNWGENFEIDFTGDKYNLLTHNGQVSCWIMVITWPASYFTYAEFVTAQSTKESCRVIANAIRYFGNRAPSIAIVDNARCFVTVHKGSHVELNESFAEFMSGIGICINAAPVRHPQCKSACEYEVLQVQNLCMQKDVKKTFSELKTIDEHSKVLQQHINLTINQGPFRNSIDKTRSYLFYTYELPDAKQVTKIPDYAEKTTTVIAPRSYLIKVSKHQYSIPYTYISKNIDVFVDNDYVVFKHEGVEIARHLRNDSEGITRDTQHMPPEHQSIVQNNEMYGTKELLLAQAKELCPEIYNFCVKKLSLTDSKGSNEYNAIRSCQGIINFYVKNSAKDIIAQCCTDLLRRTPKMWNTPCLKELYISKSSNLISKSQQTQSPVPVQIVRTNQNQAHLRDFTNNDDRALDNFVGGFIDKQ